MSDALKRAIQRARDVKFGQNADIDQLILRIAALEQRIANLEKGVDRLKAADERLQLVARIACQRMHIALEDIQSQRRDARTSIRRAILMYLARKHTELSLIKIGKFLKKDHTSIMHAIKRIEAELAKPACWVKTTVEEISAVLNRESPEVMAKAVGVEPTSSELEADVLPLN